VVPTSNDLFYIQRFHIRLRAVAAISVSVIAGMSPAHSKVSHNGNISNRRFMLALVSRKGWLVTYFRDYANANRGYGAGSTISFNFESGKLEPREVSGVRVPS